MIKPWAYRRVRRRFVRINGGLQPCRFKILFINDRPVDLPEGAAQVVDISRGGMGLFSPLRLPAHLPVVLRVRFVLGGILFDQPGRLVWRRATGDGYRYGLRFWGASPESLTAFEEWLDGLRLDVRV